MKILRILFFQRAKCKLLGGELIDRINMDAELRNLGEFALVLKFIDSDGGPYSRHNDTESEMRSFDSSCKKLFKYLKLKT